METDQTNDKTIAIVVKGGFVQEVYASLSMTDADIEILDLDSANVTDDEEERKHVLDRVAELKQKYTNIY